MTHELAQQLVKAFLKSYTEPNLSNTVSRYEYCFKFVTVLASESYSDSTMNMKQTNKQTISKGLHIDFLWCLRDL